MAILTDFLPLVVFFVVFTLKGMYWATGALMVATVVVVAAGWFRQKRLHRLPLIMLVLVMILGGATIYFQNELFIMWKPTVVYWLLALAFVVSQFVGATPLAKRLMGQALDLPDRLWRRLNLVWAVFFYLLGLANICVFSTYSDKVWVKFKVFGVLGVMVVFCLGQAIVLRKYLKAEPPAEPPPAAPPATPPAEPPASP